VYKIVLDSLKIMGEAKRREELGLLPREKKKEKQTSKNQLNKILNKYPYLPFILGFSLLAILIIDLVNYFKFSNKIWIVFVEEKIIFAIAILFFHNKNKTHETD